MQQKTLLLLLLLLLRSVVSAQESDETPELIGHKPVVTELKLVPYPPQVYRKLYIQYDYDDIDGDLENTKPGDPDRGTIIQTFLNGVLQSGDIYSPREISLSSEHVGKNLEIRVTPRSLTGDPLLGNTTTLSGVVAPFKNSLPEARNLNAWGKLEAFSYLYGSYEYYDADGDVEYDAGGSWQASNYNNYPANNALYTTVGYGDHYVVKTSDAKRYIYYTKTPCSIAPNGYGGECGARVRKLVGQVSSVVPPSPEYPEVDGIRPIYSDGLMTWSEANSLCSKSNMRLLTLDEFNGLVSMYGAAGDLQGAILKANNWPMRTYYPVWLSTPISGRPGHYFIGDLYSGGIPLGLNYPDTASAFALCIRN